MNCLRTVAASQGLGFEPKPGVAASQLLQVETVMVEHTSSMVCLECQSAILYNLLALTCLVYLFFVDHLLLFIINDTD